MVVIKLRFVRQPVGVSNETKIGSPNRYQDRGVKNSMQPESQRIHFRKSRTCRSSVSWFQRARGCIAVTTATGNFLATRTASEIPTSGPSRRMRREKLLSAPGARVCSCAPTSVSNMRREWKNITAGSGPAARPRWRPVGGHLLFLAFKKALHNVVNHAAASEVNVALKLEADKLVVIVADNGSGFNVNARPGPSHAKPDRIEQGNGLKNMSSRLSEIGGACEVHAAPGQGATVKFTVPIRV